MISNGRFFLFHQEFRQLTTGILQKTPEFR